MRKRLIAAILAAAAPAALADVLLIDGVEMAAQSAPQRPARGMSMTRVEASFGTPSQKIGAVGEPPISRWDYSAFVVYFEHDKVIHTVVRR